MSNQKHKSMGKKLRRERIRKESRKMKEVKDRRRNRKVLKRRKGQLKMSKKIKERKRMEVMMERIVSLSCISNQRIKLHKELSISDVSLIYSKQY